MRWYLTYREGTYLTIILILNYSKTWIKRSENVTVNKCLHVLFTIG